MEKKFKFTQARLDRLACPKGKTRFHFQDEMRPELLVQVTSTGAKSYYCRCWNTAKGYTDKIYLGKLEQTDLSEARSRARELAVMADQGRHPIVQRKAVRREITFAEAFHSFLTTPSNRKKKGPRREATNAEYQRQYVRYLENRIGARKLSTIDAAEVDEIHTRLGEDSGIYTANRVVTLLSGVFNDASDKGWQGVNPASRIESFPERRRDRFLEEHELGPFIKACEAENAGKSSPVADIVLLALFTGLRRKNVCSATWEHINLERGTWRIPDTEMKNGAPHTVYLCGYVNMILVRRYRQSSSDHWVFPSASKTGHVVEPKKRLSKIVRNAGINPQGVNMHCLKHTFLTYADDVGLPSAVRKRLAAHKGRSDVTEGYTHVRQSRVQEAYEIVAQHMLTLAGLNSDASITLREKPIINAPSLSTTSRSDLSNGDRSLAA